METCPLISIVLPAYNEELNIRPLFERLHPILAQLSDRFRFEFVVTDNHSTDRTFAVLQEVAARRSAGAGLSIFEELRLPAIHPYRLHAVPRGRSDPT